MLNSQPTAVFEPDGESVDLQASVAQRRYAEIMRDVEEIINDHSAFIRHLLYMYESESGSLVNSLP